MAKCHVCGERVWFWQKQVRSLDGLWVAHKKCKPEGFHKFLQEKVKDYAISKTS